MGNEIRVTREQFLATRAVFAAHRANRAAAKEARVSNIECRIKGVARVVASAEALSGAPTVATPTRRDVLKAKISRAWCRVKAAIEKRIKNH